MNEVVNKITQFSFLDYSPFIECEKFILCLIVHIFHFIKQTYNILSIIINIYKLLD